MKMLTRVIVILCYLIPVTQRAAAQQLNTYFSTLSSQAYPAKIASLKDRPIPVLFTVKKEQESYVNIMKSTYKSILFEFEDNRIIKDSLLLNRSNAIVSRIGKANRNFSFDSVEVFISRSPEPNAACYGEGTLIINLGLFLWIDNDDELALVLAHELSHQFLKHSEQRIRKNIAITSSEDFIAEMKSIKKSSEGKYVRYRALMKELIQQNGKHSRFKESEADSLAVVFIKNAGYDPLKAARVLLKLDHVDDLFSADSLYNVKAYFEKAGEGNISFQKKMKYNGLSGVEVTMNADEDIDSIKTHPDCIVRYRQISNGRDETVSCCSVISHEMQAYKERALVELVRYAYERHNYTLSSHYCLFALQNGFTNPYFNDFLSLGFSNIYAAEKRRERFSVTDAKARTGSTLKELQDFIFDCSSDNVAQLAVYFLNNDGSTEKEDRAYANTVYELCIKERDAAAAKTKFQSSFPNSKYNYLFQSLKN